MNLFSSSYEPDISDYIDQGIDAAASARDQISVDWSDSWKNFATQYALAQMQNAYNTKQSEIEFARSKEMWNMMNKYNSLFQQMKRFHEAGLNPMLIYGQGTPGNASSAAGVPTAKPAASVNAQISPNADRAQQIAMANNFVGMVSNMTSNIAGLIDQGLNLQLKKNQLVQSDFDTTLLKRTFGSVGQLGSNMSHLDETLNPLSSKFDPLAFIAFQKQGKLPSFINQYMLDDLRRLGLGASYRLTQYKSDYQNYYNKNLLPKFDQYQQGKIDLQSIEKSIDEYHRDAMMMIPPEIRGIIEPLIDYLSPFIKFIFKRSTGSFNHSVKSYEQSK